MIRKQLGNDWRFVGLTLELDNSTLNIIELDKQGFVDRAFSMMSEWLKRDTTACYCKLIYAMEKQGLGSGVEVLKREIKSSQHSS